jgi:hypothetical protein
LRVLGLRYRRGVPVSGPVAQWLEPAAHNGLVAGSSPARPTNKIKNLQNRFICWATDLATETLLLTNRQCCLVLIVRREVAIVIDDHLFARSEEVRDLARWQPLRHKP